MAGQVTFDMDFKTKATVELQKIRGNCGLWVVEDEIANLREYLVRAGLTPADIGASEAELQACSRLGHKNSAQNWLKVARDCCSYRNVSFEIGQVRDRLAAGNLALADIGSSEEELNRLLPQRSSARTFAVPNWAREDEDW